MAETETTTQADNTLYFTITHIATGVSATLNGFSLVEYQDNVSAKYSSTEVFGRMDPIMSYQATTRKIVIGLRVNDAGRDIQSHISAMMSMQYPTYTDIVGDRSVGSRNAMAISRPPLVEVKFPGLLPDDGIVAAMDGFGFTPATGFTATDSPIVRFGAADVGIAGSGVNISFANATLRFNLTVLHDKPVGWKNEGNPADISRWLGDPKFGPGIIGQIAGKN